MIQLCTGAALILFATGAIAADFPAPKEGDFIARDFRFSTGEVLPEVRLHYRTIGDPSGEPILVLHGSSGSGGSLLTPNFAGELFGVGQPLDASKFYIILPDAIGAGKSSKPSDGLRAKFPRYTYDDIVSAQHRLVSEGLRVKHLRLVIGSSSGGMQTWLWGVRHPAFMDALVPLASQPTQMAGRNWMMRRLLTESIRRDPDWNHGDYAKQPGAFKVVSAMFSVATSGGSQGWYSQAPNVETANKLADARLEAPLEADANDFIYAYEASRTYNPSPDLGKIAAQLLAINSADDERNPPELGIMEREIKLVKNGSLYAIPASESTRGHGTTGMAALWKDKLQDLLKKVPR